MKRTTVHELQELLAVEEIHPEHFRECERKASHPLARAVFKLAADKEDNHIEDLLAVAE